MVLRMFRRLIPACRRSVECGRMGGSRSASAPPRMMQGSQARFISDRRDPFNDIYRTFDRLSRDFDRMARDVDRNFVFGPFGAVRTGAGRVYKDIFGREVPVEDAAEGERKYKVELDLREYKPEDIKVTVRGRQVQVQAKKSIKTDTGSMVREYVHEFTVPEEVNPDLIRSLLQKDGRLHIEAPLPRIEPPKDEPKETEIPIDRDNK